MSVHPVVNAPLFCGSKCERAITPRRVSVSRKHPCRKVKVHASGTGHTWMSYLYHAVHAHSHLLYMEQHGQTQIRSVPRALSLKHFQKYGSLLPKQSNSTGFRGNFRSTPHTVLQFTPCFNLPGHPNTCASYSLTSSTRRCIRIAGRDRSYLLCFNLHSRAVPTPVQAAH
jgi:hypothetical protein